MYREVHVDNLILHSLALDFARAILEACETEAQVAGFKSLELMSTLPGIKLYRACSYEAEERVELEVGGGVTIGLVPMRKNLR